MDFYDDLAPLYHLLFPHWSNSIQRQGEQLDRVIQAEWPGRRKDPCDALEVLRGVRRTALRADATSRL